MELTAHGVGAEVHRLMGDGVSLQDAIDQVSHTLSASSEFPESELVPYIVRHSEQMVYQQHRPIARSNGHDIKALDTATASLTSRSLFVANAFDYLISIPGGDRKRLGEVTPQDLTCIGNYYGSFKRTYAKKELAVNSVRKTMIERGAHFLEDLGDQSFARRLMGGGGNES